MVVHPAWDWEVVSSNHCPEIILFGGRFFIFNLKENGNSETLIKGISVIAPILISVAYFTLERKILASIQSVEGLML